MNTIRGCNIPEHLLYSVEHNTWVRREHDGSVTIGLTAYAVALVGRVVSYSPKRVGKEVKKDKSCATIESERWVGPAKSPVGGEVVEVNEQVAANPALINADPYGEGWLIRIAASDWALESEALLTGQAAREAFEARMREEGFNCG
ncbi:MAG: glycine cleavage system protein H [Thiotrichales bacterium]